MKIFFIYLAIITVFVFGLKCSQVTRDEPMDRFRGERDGELDDDRDLEKYTKDSFFKKKCDPEDSVATDTMLDSITSTIGVGKYNPLTVSRRCLKHQLERVYNDICPRVEKLQAQLNRANSETERNRIQNRIFRLQNVHLRILNNYSRAAEKMHLVADKAEQRMENTNNAWVAGLNFLILDETRGTANILEMESYGDCISALDVDNRDQLF